MSMMDDFDFEETPEDEFNFEDTDMGDAPPPEEESNRTFLLVAGILGAILLLSLVLMAVYALVFVPRRRAAQNTQVAQINQQNTEVALASEMTAEAEAWTDTPTVTSTQLPITPTSSRTPVLAPTNTPADFTESPVDSSPLTETLAALYTEQAGNLTLTPGATELPDTGFADNVGVPSLLALGGALILVIFLARRLRTAR